MAIGVPREDPTRCGGLGRRVGQRAAIQPSSGGGWQAGSPRPQGQGVKGGLELSLLTLNKTCSRTPLWLVKLRKRLKANAWKQQLYLVSGNDKPLT